MQAGKCLCGVYWIEFGLKNEGVCRCFLSAFLYFVQYERQNIREGIKTEMELKLLAHGKDSSRL